MTELDKYVSHLALHTQQWLYVCCLFCQISEQCYKTCDSLWRYPWSEQEQDRCHDRFRTVWNSCPHLASLYKWMRIKRQYSDDFFIWILSPSKLFCSHHICSLLHLLPRYFVKYRSQPRFRLRLTVSANTGGDLTCFVSRFVQLWKCVMKRCREGHFTALEQA